MSKDVIFLAFANSSSEPLESLSREDDQVYAALSDRRLRGHFIIHRDSHSNPEKFVEYLDKFREQLVVFHYSGHAGRDSLLFGGQAANARGVAYQLGQIGKKGILKLVILNGCSTAGQVRGLLDAGVPVVIATSAPVEDRSATEFSIRFFHCLCKKHMNIREAFDEALGVAQTYTGRDLGIGSKKRGPELSEEDEEPLWGLFASDERALEINPLPHGGRLQKKNDYTPNKALATELFNALLKAGCEDSKLIEKHGQATLSKKQMNIVSVLPSPIGIHLQKLICPTTEEETEGFDKINLPRLQQCARVFHVTVELLAYIMLAQLWDLRLQGKIPKLSPELLTIIRDYFYLPGKERSRFDYIPFIRAIRQFLDEELQEEAGVPYFVEELDYLKGLVQSGHAFADACSYLSHLRELAAPGRISDSALPEICAEAESHLCAFFAELGFLHRYDLTSIQNIDIRKYRHQLQMEATFSHEAIKLMHAIGAEEKNHYVLPTYLDNRAVMLIKGELTLSDENVNEFTGKSLGSLNLSPFIVDLNAFDKDSDISNLFSFHQAGPGKEYYQYKKVSKPDNPDDYEEVWEEGPLKIVYRQLDAFRQIILEE